MAPASLLQREQPVPETQSSPSEGGSIGERSQWGVRISFLTQWKDFRKGLSRVGRVGGWSSIWFNIFILFYFIFILFFALFWPSADGGCPSIMVRMIFCSIHKLKTPTQIYPQIMFLGVFFKILFIYSWEKEVETQAEGEAGSIAGSPTWNSIPGLQDHALSLRQMLNRWAIQASLQQIMLYLISRHPLVWSTQD